MQLVFLDEFGKAFIPKKVRPKIRKYFLKAGITEVPYRLFGGLFYISVLITAVVFISWIYPETKDVQTALFALVTFLSWIATQLVILGVMLTGMWFYLNMRIFNRTKEIEAILPEFLRYVSENLKGGMSFDKALWDAIRPRFGILAEEIRLVAKRSMTGQDLEVALMEFTEKYDSPMVKRTFSLMVEGLKGGSEIAFLIDRIELNLRETTELKEEIIATNTSFVIFLTFIITVIAPALFGLSANLLVIISNISERLQFAQTAVTNFPIRLGQISTDPGAFQTFATYALIIIAVFTAMIISIIQKGDVKQGIKYIPIYAFTSWMMFLIFKTVFLKLFGGFG